MSRSGLSNDAGEPTFAVFAFTNMLTSLFEKEEPDRAAVVFDTSAPTFRHEMYPEYKANRTDPPEDFKPQLEKIKDMLKLMGIPQIEKDGLEADDIIGTLAYQATKNEEDAFCLTSDKDFFQLVSDHVAILRPNHLGNGIKYISYDEVEEKFGVKPGQVIDVQALLGDSIDNVPGIKGVGEKTAIPLIQEYGSLEGVYENLEKITKKALKSKLENGKEMAFLSKELVTIKIDADIPFTLDDCNLDEPEWESLDRFFDSMGFRTLRRKWQDRKIGWDGKDSGSVSEGKIIPTPIETIDTADIDYRLLSTSEDLEKALNEIPEGRFLSFDLETSSLDRDSCDIVGFAFSTEKGVAFYAPINYDRVSGKKQELDFGEEKPLHTGNSIFIEDFIKVVKPVLEDKKRPKGGQNIKFDTYILKRHTIEVSGITFDSMLASYIIDPDPKHNLDALCERWLGYKPVSITSLIGEKKKDQKSMADLKPEAVKDYACEDADLVIRLKEVLESKLKEEKLDKLARELEYPMVEVLTDMEAKGIMIDTSALAEISNDISETTAKLQESIFEEAGTEFNIDSPKQLGHVLFEKMMIPPVKKTKTGYSTNVNVLSDLANQWPIASNVLEYRQLRKLKSTYTDSLPKLINPDTGRIHTTYNQTVASTGRLSSTDPNLQNIPIRTEMGKLVRKAFVADEGKTLLSADYSQVELRIMAYISEDDTLIEAFENGLDIHAATAAGLYSKDIEDVTSDDRRIAKTVNFGIMYGLGVFGLSQRLGLERSHSKEIIDTYFESYPGIKKYIDETKSFVKVNGYAETLFGRRRYFKDINSSNRTAQQAAERGAINLPIQGTAADMMKVAMIKIHEILKDRSYKADMLLQVHDEIIIEVEHDRYDATAEMVKREMESSISLGRVPVIVDTGKGLNWLDAH
jgi:DNA polymerase-1